MGILAKALLYPGASTLIMNLITSFSDDNDNDKNKQEALGSWVGYDLNYLCLVFCIITYTIDDVN